MHGGRKIGQSITFLLSTPPGQGSRVLAGLDPQNWPHFVHGAVDVSSVFIEIWVLLPVVKADPKLDQDYSGAIILAPPAMEDSSWTRSFRQASGCVRLDESRSRRRKNYGSGVRFIRSWIGKG